mgnify:CR=1 FL=1
MRMAVMQPYLFPYVGYFQLICASDFFVVYDDVAYIKNGYINRNKIRSGTESARFTIPVPGASINKKIKDLNFSEDVGKVLKTLRYAYSKAPYYDAVYPMVERVLTYKERSIGRLCKYSYDEICKYLEIGTNIELSSDLLYDRDSRAEDRLIDLCKRYSATEYVNSEGGRHLYNKEHFSKHGVILYFLMPGEIKYNQGGKDFIKNLSIIDMLMWCPKEEISQHLNCYQLE